jgi:hypothetical protein
MPTLLTTSAVDLSTYVVTASFTDETGAAVTPDTLVWSLYDEDGQVINARSDVALIPGETVTIVLSGADLRYSDGMRRYIVLEGTYDSTNGDDLPLREQVAIDVIKLVA